MHGNPDVTYCSWSREGQVYPNFAKKMSNNISKIYSNISKMIKDIPRYTKYKPAAGPPRPARRLWRRARAGRGGPAAAWYFVYLNISLYFLDLLGYLWIYMFVYSWSILDICLDNLFCIFAQTSTETCSWEPQTFPINLSRGDLAKSGFSSNWFCETFVQMLHEMGWVDKVA